MNQETMDAASPPRVATKSESPAHPAVKPGLPADAKPVDAGNSLRR